MKQPSVLLIYTGGTIGMWADPKSGALQPMDLAHLEEQVPELERVKVDLEAVAFEEPIDSSDMNPEHWVRLAEIVGENYDQYDGFVVLHGSDTMAYTASALSFPVSYTHLTLPTSDLV